MIAFTAYGIRKAYKKQQARKARKEQLERKNKSRTGAGSTDDFHSPFSSSDRLSSDLPRSPVNGGLVNYDPRSPSTLNRVQSTSASGYSTSLYSQVSYKDPMEEMRQYQAYVQRQSNGFIGDANPPTYEFVVEQGIEPAHPWKSGLNFPTIESPSERRESRHIPEIPNRVVELDSSSESSPSATEHVPLKLFHPRSLATHDNEITYPATELPADFTERFVSPILDDEMQASLDELVAEYPPPLRIRKSTETERYELPANEITPRRAVNDVEHQEEYERKQEQEQEQEQEHEHVNESEHEQGREQKHESHKTEHERPQLKRPRAESISDIEAEDNEDVIVRFNVADRTKRPLSKRHTMTEDE
jgi:hypothetical protein